MILNEIEIIKEFKKNRSRFKWFVFISLISWLILMFLLKNYFQWSNFRVPLLGVHFDVLITSIIPISTYIYCRHKYWKCPNCKEKLEIGHYPYELKKSSLKNCHLCGVSFEYGVKPKPPNLKKIRVLEFSKGGIRSLWKSHKRKKEIDNALNEIKKLKNEIK